MSETDKRTEAPEEETGRKKKKEKVKRTVGQEILSWILTIVVAVVAALLIRSFIFEPVRVDGSSMDDTLANGEIMLVSKYDYSTTWLSFFWQDNGAKENAPRITFGGNPQRFDVVICRYPGRGDTNFVKRVVGLPGDTIRLENGYLYVKEAGQEEEVMYKEPYINDEYRSGPLNTFRAYEVPEGKYFVMGDHRNNSNDSRSVGPIDRSMIVGHVRRVVFPFNQWRGVPNGMDVSEE
ncbi:MAG: signal peptidase I [Clostridia bacterium]|nr:signal peptidase I [Clostridia bacterium]